MMLTHYHILLNLSFALTLLHIRLQMRETSVFIMYHSYTWRGHKPWHTQIYLYVTVYPLPSGLRLCQQQWSSWSRMENKMAPYSWWSMERYSLMLTPRGNTTPNTSLERTVNNGVTLSIIAPITQFNQQNWLVLRYIPNIYTHTYQENVTSLK